MGSSVSAQTGPSSGELVDGKLIQQGSDEPLPFATVALYSVADSTLAASALTDDKGLFSTTIKNGEYYADIKYLGFEDLTIQDIIVEGKPVHLGVIGLKQQSVALDEVEIEAERSQMEFKLDRRVFNVGKDLTTSGSSAADILDNVPSVTVDPEGNVSLRGSQSVRILVDGKPSGLISAGDTEALLRMQGDIIESIEVITNPSARYEAEGEAGIINIILKKNQKKGFNGSFGATAGYPHNYGASYNLNYRKRNFNFFSNFGLDYRRAPGGGNSSQRFFDNGMLTEYYTTQTDQERGGFGGYMQFGTDWNIDERSTLTGSLLYRLGEDDNDAMVTYRDFSSNEILLSETIRDVDEIEREHNLETSLFFKRTFDEEDREWNTTFSYILDDDTEIADYVQTGGQMEEPLIQESSNTEDEINMLFQTDYVHPIGEQSKIEGGLRATWRTVNNDFFVKEQQDDGSLEIVENFDNRLKYTEDIYAAYVIGAHEISDFGFQAGLRMEISDVTAALIKTSEQNDQDYVSLFPSASATYSMTEESQLQVSYSRRLSRPYFRRLLPFSNFNNPRNNSIGNPNLRPEFTNSFEAGFLRYFTNGSLLSSVYYRKTTGVIERLILPNDDGTTIRYPVNLSQRDAYGLEFNFSYDLKSWWNVTSDLNFFRSIVDGQFEGVDYSADTYTWGGRVMTKVDIGDDFKLQASYDYNAPNRTTQGRDLSSQSFDLAASLDVFGGKGTFTLTGRDLFNTDKHRSVINQENYQARSVFQWRQRRQVVLSFNYRLNQEKQDQELLGGNGPE